MDNVINIRIQVENKFSNVNCIFNNMNPIKNEKSLILNILLCNFLLSKYGICIVKIKSPHVWCDIYRSYIQLYSMFFYSVNIIKFPVCIRNRYFYNYFILAHTKKKILNNNIIRENIISCYISSDKRIIKYNTINSENDDINSELKKTEKKMINEDINKQILYDIIETIL